MIKVWTDAAEAGLLDRQRDRGSAFAYLPETAPQRTVSLTMPVRLPSWNVPFGLAPIFEMNLPEGALRERLRLAFAKATGTFDDFDLLAIHGESQLLVFGDDAQRVFRPRVRLDRTDFEPWDERLRFVIFQPCDCNIAIRRDEDLIAILVICREHRERDIVWIVGFGRRRGECKNGAIVAVLGVESRV